jgi:hypothetical protein
MTTLQVTAAAFHIANAQSEMDEHSLLRIDTRLRRLRDEYPKQTALAHLDPFEDEPPIDNPWEEINVEVSPSGVIRRDIGPLDKLIIGRMTVVQTLITQALQEYMVPVRNIVSLLGEAMRKRTIVHVIGAGRALLAASLPANRLAHGGAQVYILGDKVPSPNSRYAGVLIAASASGQTRAVLEIMTFAQTINQEHRLLGYKEIMIIGIADRNARQVEPFRPFPELCTPGYFIGIPPASRVTLRALADIEEQAINQLLDALVAAAGLEIGVNWRRGHENLVGGATGPWHQYSR